MSTPTASRSALDKERRQRQDAQQVSGKAPKSARLTPLKIYLLAYNAISAGLWAHLLYITVSFLLTSRPSSPASAGWWTRLASSSPLARRLFSSLPSPLAGVSTYLSGSYEYKSLGWYTKYTQSLAVLEVVHAALGWVRSPLGTTASQVASRLYTVWGVVEAVPSTHSNPLFTTMLLAWSLTEVIRYSYYFTSLLSIRLPILDYLRYTTFYPLYPLGASSEAFIAFSTLPSFSALPIPSSIRALNPLRSLVTALPDPLRKALVSTEWGRRILWNLARLGAGSAKAKAKGAAGLGREWGAVDYVRLGLFCVWWPSLYALYTYMIKQRKKVLGKGGKGKTVGGANKAR